MKIDIIWSIFNFLMKKYFIFLINKHVFFNFLLKKTISYYWTYLILFAHENIKGVLFDIFIY